MPAAKLAGLTIYCKRDDLFILRPGTALQGNKVRKLLPTLLAARTGQHYLSFGGAYSNHLAALAVAHRDFGLSVTCFVRGGERPTPQLQLAESCGLPLVRLTRSAYRHRNDPAWLMEMRQRLAHERQLNPADVLIIPEGGSTPAGILACGEALTETTVQLGNPPDFFCLSAGTGGTAAGVISAATTATTVEVFPALPGNWMRREITAKLPRPPAAPWRVFPEYALNGYAKYPAAWRTDTPGLNARADLGVAGLPPLEPIYTAKLFRGVLTRMAAGHYPRGGTVVILHTGGIY